MYEPIDQNARRIARSAGVTEQRLLELDRRAAVIVRSLHGVIPQGDMHVLSNAELEYLASAVVALKEERG